MQHNRMLIWNIINDQTHDKTKKAHRPIRSAAPIIDSLFPGIEFGDGADLVRLINEYVRPALSVQFPTLINKDPRKIYPHERVEVTAMLTSDKGEWQRDKKWPTKFKKMISEKQQERKVKKVC